MKMFEEAIDAPTNAPYAPDAAPPKKPNQVDAESHFHLNGFNCHLLAALPPNQPPIAAPKAGMSQKILPSLSTYIIGAFPQNRYGLATCAAGSTLNHRPSTGS